MKYVARAERLPSSHLPFCWSLTFDKDKPVDFMDMISVLKGIVHSSDRRYIPATRTWLFTCGVIDDVGKVLSIYDTALVISAGTQALPPARVAALEELFLLPNAPAFLIEAVYKTLAKKYHPDHGGSNEKMQRLNAVMEVLR